MMKRCILCAFLATGACAASAQPAPPPQLSPSEMALAIDDAVNNMARQLTQATQMIQQLRADVVTVAQERDALKQERDALKLKSEADKPAPAAPAQ